MHYVIMLIFSLTIRHNNKGAVSVIIYQGYITVIWHLLTFTQSKRYGNNINFVLSRQLREFILKSKMTKIPLVIEQICLLNMVYILHAWIRKWQHMSLMGHDDLTLSEYLIYLSDFWSSCWLSLYPFLKCFYLIFCFCFLFFLIPDRPFIRISLGILYFWDYLII